MSLRSNIDYTSHLELPGKVNMSFNKGYVKVQICEGTNRMCGWLVYDPTSIPRQLRFSFYSGAVITEGLT